jgi:hypothetical protein
MIEEQNMSVPELIDWTWAILGPARAEEARAWNTTARTGGF